MKNIKYKYRKVYILEWKSVKEANSHIDFLPKNLNFKKIIKNHEFHGFLLVHPLNILFFIKNC